MTTSLPFTEPIEMAPHLSGCPYDAYAQLREAGGAHQAVKPSGGQVWVISRYADVKALLSDPRMSIEARNSRHGYQGFGLPPALDEHLMNVDDEAHARLRRLVSSAASRHSATASKQPSTDRSPLSPRTARPTSSLNSPPRPRRRRCVDLLVAFRP